jgi:hypothetical protein
MEACMQQNAYATVAFQRLHVFWSSDNAAARGNYNALSIA